MAHHSTPSIHVVAAIILRGNQVFATQRGYGDFKGWWEFPGGKIDAGESHQQALTREIMEELNADIEVRDLLKTVEWDYPTFHLTMHCYICTLKSESVQLNEHLASAWLTKETLDSVNWLPADVEILELIRQLISA